MEWGGVRPTLGPCRIQRVAHEMRTTSHLASIDGQRRCRAGVHHVCAAIECLHKIDPPNHIRRVRLDGWHRPAIRSSSLHKWKRPPYITWVAQLSLPTRDCSPRLVIFYCEQAFTRQSRISSIFSFGRATVISTMLSSIPSNMSVCEGPCTLL